MSTRVGQSRRVMKLETHDTQAMENGMEFEVAPSAETRMPAETSAPPTVGPEETDPAAMPVIEPAKMADSATLAAGEGQLELGLRATPPARPRRVVKTRRYAVARWWFAQMRETVRATREWSANETRRTGTDQALLTLPMPPTRFEGRRAA